MRCENCGAEVIEGRFCNYCGSELPKEENVSIKGNNNTVNTINNYYSPKEERNKYVEPELIEFVPKDDSFLKREVRLYIFISVLLLLVYIAYSLIIGHFSIGLTLIVIVIFVYLYKSHRERAQEFYDSECERENHINRINQKRQYDAWFDSLTEAEKQTELMRRMVKSRETF